MSDPLISVIVPAYTRGDFLREALLSVHVQSHPNLEILVVDDASELAIESILASAAACAPNPREVRVIRHETRRGANAARNTGWQAAKGEYIQFMDSDDIMHPRKLARQVAILEDRPKLDAVVSQDLVFESIPGDRLTVWNSLNPDEDDHDYLDQFMSDNPLWQTGSPLWRRRSIDRVGPWEEKLISWQDWEFHVRALALGLHFHREGDVGQYLREHDHGRGKDRGHLAARESSKILAGKRVERTLTRTQRWSPLRHRGMATFYFDKTLRLNIREHRAWMTKYVMAGMRNCRTPAQSALCLHLLMVLIFRGLFLTIDEHPFRDLLETGLDRVGLRAPPGEWKRCKLDAHEVEPDWWPHFENLRAREDG